MQYLLLIYNDEVADARRSKEVLDAEMAAYWAFTEEIQKSGVYKGGNALHPTSTATTVRVRNGKIGTTDGPFAETKEQLGGYYLWKRRILMRRSSGRPKFRTLLLPRSRSDLWSNFSQTASA